MSRTHSFKNRDPAAPAVPPPAVAGLTGLAAFGVDGVTGRTRILPGWLRPFGFGVAISGIALSVWAMLHFRQRAVDHSPWHRPTGFVTDGPYAISRNPMYTGAMLALLGIGLIRGSLAGLLSPLAFMTILTRGQIAFEERALQEAYGTEYDEYRGRVRRWI